MIARLPGDPTFAKFCQDALEHTLRHPQIYILRTLDWGGVGPGWVGSIGDGRACRGEGDGLGWGWGLSVGWDVWGRDVA